MKRAFPSSSLLLVLLALAAACSLHVAHANFGDTIATTYEAVDLSEAHPEDAAEEARSMEGLLHWAIANSDPEELAKRADEARTETLLQDLAQQLEERRARVRELKKYMDSQVTETQLMKESLAVLALSNATMQERLTALQDLQPLVEPVDNANDLKPLGGIPLIVEHLFVRDGRSANGERHGRRVSDPSAAAEASDADKLRAAAAYCLGTAASNNVRFQADLLEAFPDIFDHLLPLCTDPVEEVGVKGTYAVAAMVRNLPQAYQAFVNAGGPAVLERLLTGADVSVRVKRKALSLVMDLTHLAHSGAARAAAHNGVTEATLQLLGTDDWDMVEKALEALQALLQGPGKVQAAAHLRQAGAGSQLEALQAKLVQAKGEDEDDSYLGYLAASCNKTRQLLDQAPEVPKSSSAEFEAGGLGADQGEGVEGSLGAGGENPRGRWRRAAESRDEGGADEPLLQLGHAEL